MRRKDELSSSLSKQALVPQGLSPGHVCSQLDVGVLDWMKQKAMGNCFWAWVSRPGYQTTDHL